MAANVSIMTLRQRQATAIVGLVLLVLGLDAVLIYVTVLDGRPAPDIGAGGVLVGGILAAIVGSALLLSTLGGPYRK